MRTRPPVVFPVFVGLLALVVGACSGNSGHPSNGGGTDTTPPVVTVTSPATSPTLDYTLTGTASDDVGVVRLDYALNGADPVDITAGASFSADLTLVAGSNIIHVEALDAAGNTGSATLEVVATAPDTAPVAQDGTVTLSEDTPTAVTLAATDAEDDPLTFAVVDQPAHGTLSGTPPTLTYTPEADFNGSDALTFKANDGQLDSQPAAVALTVRPVNDPPTAVFSAELNTDEDTLLVLDLVVSDVDNPATDLSLLVTAAPSHGSLDVSDIAHATYTPAADYAGDDAFTLVASDGQANSDPIAITVHVHPVDDPATAQDQSVQTREDTPVAIDLGAVDPDSPLDVLVFRLVSLPDSGTLEDAVEGVPFTEGDLGQALPSPHLTFVPAPNFAGATSFSFDVASPSQTTPDQGDVAVTVLEGTIFYLAPDGDDAHTGLSPAQAKRTLAAAIAAADTVEGAEVPDQIVLAPGRYCTAGVQVDRSVVIAGPHDDTAILDGSSADPDCTEVLPLDCSARTDAGWASDGVLQVWGDQAGPVAISDVTIENGTATTDYGGAIRTNFRLFLRRVVFKDNCAQSGGALGLLPGADAPFPTLIQDCDFADNAAQVGGAIFSYAAFDVEGGVFTGNRAALSPFTAAKGLPSDYGYGGAVFHSGGALTVSGATFDHNSAEALGGALYIENAGDGAVIDGTTLSNNGANDGGGALVAADGPVTIGASTLAGNRATQDTDTPSAQGGALLVTQGAHVDVVNSTLTGSTADEGGAIYVDSGSVGLYYTTAFNNVGGDTSAAMVGAIEATGTVVAGGAPYECPPDSFDFVTDGYNLDDDSTCLCHGDGICPSNETDLPGQDAGLDDTLGDNGGPTQTHTLLEGSPLIDGGAPGDLCLGPDDAVLGVDQRGQPRPTTSDGRCDIGSVEVP